jgi:hypothetical protein
VFKKFLWCKLEFIGKLLLVQMKTGVSMFGLKKLIIITRQPSLKIKREVARVGSYPSKFQQLQGERVWIDHRPPARRNKIL